NMAAWLGDVGRARSGIETGEPHVGVLVDRRRSITAFARGHQYQPIFRGAVAERTLGVGGLDAFALRLNPDLQQMHRIDGRIVKLAVGDAAARADALYVARLEDSLVAQAITMLQRPAQNVSDDFHVAMGMRAEAAATRDGVIIDHPKRAESHPMRIIVIREGKRVVSVQPAVVGVAPFVGSSNCHHSCPDNMLVACQLMGASQRAQNPPCWRGFNRDWPILRDQTGINADALFTRFALIDNATELHQAALRASNTG